MVKPEKLSLNGAPPKLVAHRGYSGRFPENTLLAYESTLEYGALYVELDLQMTNDQVPVLHHDQTLLRMAGSDVDIRDISAKDFKKLKASYGERFGDEFKKNSFATFKKFCKWLKRNPQITAFVEIKQESIDRFGTSVFIDEVYRRILKTNVESQCVIISFNDESLEYTRKISSMPIGWVLPHWTAEVHQRAKELEPEFLFCDKDELPNSDAQIWSGGWQWAVYNLDDVDSAIAMANRGIPILETNEIGTLMKDQAFLKPVK